MGGIATGENNNGSGSNFKAGASGSRVRGRPNQNGNLDSEYVKSFASKKSQNLLDLGGGFGKNQNNADDDPISDIQNISQNKQENKIDTNISSSSFNSVEDDVTISSNDLQTNGVDLDAKNKAYGEIKAQERKAQQEADLKARQAKQRIEDKAQAEKQKLEIQQVKQQAQKSRQSATHPTVSPEVQRENESIANHLVNKSSETSGLPSIFDHMYQEDPKTAEANLQNLIQQTTDQDPKVGNQLAQALFPTQQKYLKEVENSNQLLGRIRSGQSQEVKKAMQEMMNIRAEDEQAYQALPEEARKWFEAYQVKYRTNAPNFFDDTPKDIKEKNHISALIRGKEAGGSLYSDLAATEEISDFGNKLAIGWSLLNGDQPDYEAFDREMKALRDQVPEIYRNTSTFQGGSELTGLLTTALEATPLLGASASSGDVAQKLAKTGLSPNAQRLGAGIAGLTNILGGGLGLKATNKILIQNFGKDLEKLTSKELATLSETLFGKGMELTVNGITDKFIRGRDGKTENPD